MTTALDIMTRATRITHDEQYKRWSKAEMLDWTSEAQIIVARNPGVYNKTVVQSLDKGSRQFLPKDGWGLITATCNVGEYGLGSVVKVTTRDLLDSFNPYWHSDPAQRIVESYVYDTRQPTEFSVYPPNDGTGKLEITYMAIPKQFTDPSEEIVLDDTYIPALVNYVVYRAYCKESEYSPGISNAQAYFSAYQQELLTALSVRDSTTPNATLMKIIGARSMQPNVAVAPSGSTE